MGYQLEHTWVTGTNVMGAQLSTCSHCGVLRTEIVTSLASLTHYIRPTRRGRVLGDGERVTLTTPPCVTVEKERAA